MRPLCFLALLFASHCFAAGKTEILWDQYGVPHIFAANRESMFHAHGYAQMQNQADLLLRLYGESRGRAAEYWGGAANLELDRWIQLNGVPERAKAWSDTAASHLPQIPRRLRCRHQRFRQGASRRHRSEISHSPPCHRRGRRRTHSARRPLHVHGLAGSHASRGERHAQRHNRRPAQTFRTGTRSPAPTPGPSALPFPPAAMRCSSSIRISPGATRSTATWKSIS